MGDECADRTGFQRLSVQVSAVRRETSDIVTIELTRADASELPPFTAGAHVEFHLGDGLVRQYSLCNPPSERHRYVVGVLKQKNGRGGSDAMHALRAGSSVLIEGPRNHFALAGREANAHLLLAGGIGVTPMMAMIAELEERGAEFVLHYCTRSPEQTAFREQLQPLIASGKAILHHDAGDPAKSLDIAALLAEPQPAQHLYVCGPQGFIAAAKAATGAWAPHAVHFEHFDAVALTEEQSAWDTVPFQIKIKRTGAVYDVPANTSIVKVLREHGIDIETSCEDGYCGTCITRYVGGEPVHRDTVLSEAERRSYVMVCRARASSPLLVLDV